MALPYMFPTIIAKNNSGVAIVLSDLGISIPATSQINLTNLFDELMIAESNDLKTKVNDGTIVINDGTSDLSITDALDRINLWNVYQIKANTNTIQPSGAPPSGGLWVNANDNLAYTYDTVRGKWLSTYRIPYVFQRDGNADGIYLRIGEVALATVGYYMFRPATLTGAYIEAASGATGKLYDIYASSTLLTTLTATGLNYYNLNLNIDINAGSRLRVFVSATGAAVNSVVAQLEIAWRYVP